MSWEAFLEKALSNLRVARLALQHKEYDPCVSRAYYSVFHAEIAALLCFTNFRQEQWKHETVQAEFNRRLIRERKVFGTELVFIHNELIGRRHAADYRPRKTSETVAKRCLAKAEALVRAIQAKVEEKP